jgi:hypothetical protein
MKIKFQKIHYSKLNSRQKENYNFLKVSAILAEYGFNTLRLSDDWQGADFIAQHIDGNLFLKVQLKGRLTLEKKYLGKDIWMCFRTDDGCCLYHHDTAVEEIEAITPFIHTTSWKKTAGDYSFSKPSKELRGFITNNELKNEKV